MHGVEREIQKERLILVAFDEIDRAIAESVGQIRNRGYRASAVVDWTLDRRSGRNAVR
jgi:hypothetical protein